MSDVQQSIITYIPVMGDKLTIGRDKRQPDLSGMRFGSLTVKYRVGHLQKNGKWSPKAYWLCECDCGKSTVVEGNNLKKGYVKSCGCKGCRPNTTHGGSRTKLYYVWYNMKTRCNNPHSNMFAVYGGRGINICDEWVHDFACFREWSLSNGYKEGLTIDRIDNDKGYTPENCRWVPQDINRKHQRKNIKIEYKGRVFISLADFSKYLKMSYQTLGDWYRDGTLEKRTGAEIITNSKPIED